jgi:hypothetical protein
MRNRETGRGTGDLVLFGATGMVGQGVRREVAYSIIMWHLRADLLPKNMEIRRRRLARKLAHHVASAPKFRIYFLYYTL